jgi:hypothetical protein
MFRLFLMFSSSLFAWGINSPWVHLNSLLKASIGADSCASVGEFQDATASITINVCDTDTAVALANILKPTYQAGRKVTLIIVDPNGNTVAAAADPGGDLKPFAETNLDQALDNNPYYRGWIPSQGFTPLYAMFSKKVIQFWDDNQGDPNGNSSYTAEEVFSQSLPNWHGYHRIVSKLTPGPPSTT